MKRTILFGKILIVWVTISSQVSFAQQSPNQASGLQNATEKIIRGYYTAYEKKDWNSMEQLLADGFTFTSPNNDDHINVKAFKAKCWPESTKIKKFDLKKIIGNGNEAFVLNLCTTTSGTLILNTDYFKVENGKIKEVTVFFGPGPGYPDNQSSKK
jgi:SnoaL-like protein